MMVQPKLYAENNRITKDIAKKCLEKYEHIIKWRNHPSILEIGHGDGGNSQESFVPILPKDVKELVATDISDSMVEYARKNSTRPFIKFAQLDIATKEVPSEYVDRFDHIFGFFVMHLVKDTRQSFKNMYKMLKPGGSIFMTILERLPVDDAIEKLSKDPEWNKYGVNDVQAPYHYSPNPRLEWEKDLNETGFQNHVFFEEESTYELLGNEFDNLLLSVCVFLPKIPSEKLEEFKETYKKLTRQGRTISTEVRDGKEIVLFNHKLFIVYASKP